MVSVLAARVDDIRTPWPAVVLSIRRDYQEVDRRAWAGFRGGEGVVRCRRFAGARGDMRKSRRGKNGVLWGYHNDFVELSLYVTPHFFDL